MKIAIILNAPALKAKVEEQKVIFADAGYKFRKKLKDKEILLVVGDFDSLSKIPKSEKTLLLEREKNFTDGEMAIRKAKELGAKEVTIYGALGGRIDHVLGNLSLLKIARDLGLNATIKEVGTKAFLVEGRGDFAVKKGATLSLFSLGEKCHFNCTKGLYYPLVDLVLNFGDTRGISNVATNDKVEYEIKDGTALVIINEQKNG